jgi:integral membrane protein mviN
LGGYNLDGFAWASKISAVITLIICGLTMLFSYVVMLKIFRVREADALFAPIAGKVKALARRGASNES